MRLFVRRNTFETHHKDKLQILSTQRFASFEILDARCTSPTHFAEKKPKISTRPSVSETTPNNDDMAGKKKKTYSVIIHVVNLLCHSLWPSAFKEPKLHKWLRLTKFLQYQQPIA